MLFRCPWRYLMIFRTSFLKTIIFNLILTKLKSWSYFLYVDTECIVLLSCQESGIHKCTEKEYPFVLWEWWVHVCLVNQSITYYYIYRLSPGNITLLYAPMLSQKKQSWYCEEIDMHNYITWSKCHFATICLLISIGWNKDANALLLYMESLLHKTFMRDNCIKF